jgi:hypothetical protein
MRLPVPGPRDVMSALERGSEQVEALLGAVPRMLALLDQAEVLLVRASAIVDRVEVVADAATAEVARVGTVVDAATAEVARVGGVVDAATAEVGRVGGVVDAATGEVGRVGGVVDAATAEVARVGTVVDAATAEVGRVGGVVDAATTAVARVGTVVDAAAAEIERVDAVVDGAAVQAGRAGGLLDALEPSLTKLQPTLQTLADTTHPDEVAALVTLVDHLPAVTEQFERDILPGDPGVGGPRPARPARRLPGAQRDPRQDPRPRTHQAPRRGGGRGRRSMIHGNPLDARPVPPAQERGRSSRLTKGCLP